MTDTIKRFTKSKGYESLPRDLLQNNKLSLASRGLLVNMASYPDTWILRKEELVHRFKESHSAVRKMWDELVENNYILQFYKRAGKRYQYKYYFNTEPFTVEEISEMLQQEYNNEYELYHKEILKIKDKSQLNIMDFIYIEDKQKDILKLFISAYSFEPLKSGVPENAVKSTLFEPLDLGVPNAEANKLTIKEINYIDDDDLYKGAQKTEGTSLPKIQEVSTIASNPVLHEANQYLREIHLNLEDRKGVILWLRDNEAYQDLGLIKAQIDYMLKHAEKESISDFAAFFSFGIKRRFVFAEAHKQQADKYAKFVIPI